MSRDYSAEDNTGPEIVYALRRIADALEQIAESIDTAKGDAVAGAMEVAANEVEALPDNSPYYAPDSVGLNDVLAILRRPRR